MTYIFAITSILSLYLMRRAFRSENYFGSLILAGLSGILLSEFLELLLIK